MFWLEPSYLTVSPLLSLPEPTCCHLCLAKEAGAAVASGGKWLESYRAQNSMERRRSRGRFGGSELQRKE